MSEGLLTDQRMTRARGAFTLMEIMIVVGIMGIALTLGVPIVYKVWHRTPMVQAIRDFREVCNNARMQAILQGQPVDLVLHPKANRIEVAAASAAPVPVTAATVVANTAPPAQPAASVPQGSGFSAQLSDRIIIETLDINMAGIEYNDAESARVRFYPNGTSDEMRLILFDGRDRYGITLEVMTGLCDVVPDPLRAWTK
jgi:prepilin-type N-terminal cleavage/methylation domain-containing protein